MLNYYANVPIEKLRATGSDCSFNAREGAGVGGRVLPYISYIRMSCPHRVGFLRRFGLKTGIHFAHFGLESGWVFEGTTECMNGFIVSVPKGVRKKEKICEFEMGLKYCVPTSRKQS